MKKNLIVSSADNKYFDLLLIPEHDNIVGKNIINTKGALSFIDDNKIKKFNKKIEGKVVIDKNIIGGTKIIVGDSVIDASVRAQLDNLAFTLKA